jgi:hypothetical protein
VQFRARRLDNAELSGLLDTFSRRVVRVLERRGLLIADPVDPYLNLEPGSFNRTEGFSRKLSYCFYY